MVESMKIINAKVITEEAVKENEMKKADQGDCACQADTDCACEVYNDCACATF